MRKSTDTAQRLMAILELMPHSPRMLSTGDIHRKLRGIGMDVDIRSVQRDLERLSQRYPITDTRKGAKHFWCFIDFHYMPRLPPIAQGSARPPATRPRMNKNRTATSGTKRKTPIKTQDFMAVVYEPILGILQEHPITENQTIILRSKNIATVRAEIEVTDDFVLWLKRCGPEIVVMKPSGLRQTLGEYAWAYAMAYRNHPAPGTFKKEVALMQKLNRVLPKPKVQEITLLYASKEMVNQVRRGHKQGHASRQKGAARGSNR